MDFENINENMIRVNISRCQEPVTNLAVSDGESIETKKQVFEKR